jgi:hypothetical protein
MTNGSMIARLLFYVSVAGCRSMITRLSAGMSVVRDTRWPGSGTTPRSGGAGVARGLVVRGLVV